MDVNEHKRLSTITLSDQIKYKNIDFIAFLHFTFSVGYATMAIAHTLVCNKFDRYSTSVAFHISLA